MEVIEFESFAYFFEHYMTFVLMCYSARLVFTLMFPEKLVTELFK